MKDISTENAHKIKPTRRLIQYTRKSSWRRHVNRYLKDGARVRDRGRDGGGIAQHIVERRFSRGATDEQQGEVYTISADEATKTRWERRKRHARRQRYARREGFTLKCRES